MLKYLREAFLAGPVLRGLGRVPANALAVSGFALLGFVDSGFWWVGLGLEAGYLALLASHPRFRRWIDAVERLADDPASEAGRASAVARLQPSARDRLRRLDEKIARIFQVYREVETDELVIDVNRGAFEQLSVAYLRLLAARDRLQASKVSAVPADVRHRIAELEREAAAAEISPALRQSRAATVELLRQRLANLEQCEMALAEVDGDLERVEAQVDLSLENARLRGGGDVVPPRIELVSKLFLADDPVFGSASEGSEVVSPVGGRKVSANVR